MHCLIYLRDVLIFVRFSSTRMVLIEEGHEAHLTVVRRQGSFHEVHVSWNISSGAFPDVYPPNGTLTFRDVS